MTPHDKDHWKTWRLVILGLGLVEMLLGGCAHLTPQTKTRQARALLFLTFDVSPDGKQIVFPGESNGSTNLYLLDLTTHKVTQLTSTPGDKNYPAFSPDGKMLVYQCATGSDQAGHLFLRSLDGKYTRQLTNTPGTSDSNPRFSPNGEEVVFTRFQKYHLADRGDDIWAMPNVFVINRNGSPLVQVTHLNNDGMIRPRFYLDNRHILFERTTVDNMYLVKADSDGKEPMQDAVRFSGSDSAPCFFPDGKQIVFGGNFNGILDLYRVSLAGGKPSKILFDRDNTGFWYPIVTADGKRIYCMERYNPNLYRMNVDGTDLQEIADSSLFSDPMHWKPSPKQ